jgi:hypothetical protein
MRKPDPITSEAKEAKKKELEEARHIAIGEQLEDERQGNMLNRALNGEQEAAWYKQFIGQIKSNLPQYYQKQATEQLEAQQKVFDLKKSTI